MLVIYGWVLVRIQWNGEWKGPGRHMAQGVLSMFISFYNKFNEVRINCALMFHNFKRSEGQMYKKEWKITFGGLGEEICWEDLQTFFKRVSKGRFCSLFIVNSLVWHLPLVSCFSYLAQNLLPPLHLIGSVNILTNSVGLFYLSFSQMYNLTLPRQPASPQHLGKLLSAPLS